MPPRIGDIDRWIEEGLTRYGKGEVDAALEAWETALSIDPDNERASSYVDYVRSNYDLLMEGQQAGATPAGPDDVMAGLPYPMGDAEVDYQIEILSGDLPPVEPGPIEARPSMEAIDEGWSIDDELNRAAVAPRPALPIPAPRASTPELDALSLAIDRDRPAPPAAQPAAYDDDDEPEINISRTISAEPPRVEIQLELDPPDAEPPAPGSEAGLSFDDATREYQKGRPPTRDLDLSAGSPLRAATPNEFDRPELTPAFGSAADLQTPNSFGHQTTGIRKRDMGFVKASPAVTAAAVPIGGRGDEPKKATTLQGLVPVPHAPAPATIPPANVARDRRASAVPELKMTLRTPEITLEAPGAADDDVDHHLTLERRDVGMPERDRPTPPQPSVEVREIRDVREDRPTERNPKLERAIRLAEPDGVALGPSGSRTTTLEREEEERLFGSDVETKDIPRAQELAGSLGRAPRPASEIELGAAGGARAASTRELSATDSAAAAAAASQLARPSTREMPGATRQPASPSRPPSNQPFGLGAAGAPAPESPPPLGGSPGIASQPTRDLGLRPHRLPTEEEATREIARPDLAGPRPPVVGAKPAARTPHKTAELAPTNLLDTAAQLIMDVVDRDAPADESRDDRTRRRISGLLERAAAWMAGGEADKAVAAVDLALDEDAASALAQKLVHRNRDAIMGVFQTYLGDLQRQPVLARPLAELASAPIGPRAAFLLSRIDGMLSLDEILDVSGMPRLEAYRYLCQLFLRGILK